MKEYRDLKEVLTHCLHRKLYVKGRDGRDIYLHDIEERTFREVIKINY
tara:strand:+ start:435 stop:578 length:144 start_codon:yes stop_codon:yes gene_type:complete